MSKWSLVAQHRWALIGIGGMAVVLAVAAGVWFFLLRSPGTPLSLRAALKLYRHDELAGATDGRLPPPGVYQYRTSGSEQLSVAGINRAFPASTDMIVTGSRCSDMNWEALEQHAEAMVVCPSGSSGGLTVASTTTFEQIAGVTTNQVVHCDSGAYLMPPNPWAGERWRSSCRSPGVKITMVGRVIGVSPVRVGHSVVSALHTRITFEYAGSQSGSTPSDYWLSGDGLILRQQEASHVSQSAGPLGSIRYTEQMKVALESLSPVR